MHRIIICYIVIILENENVFLKFTLYILMIQIYKLYFNIKLYKFKFEMIIE